MLFQADYDEIKLQNLVMTSFQWRYHHYIIVKRHQNNVTYLKGVAREPGPPPQSK